MQISRARSFALFLLPDSKHRNNFISWFGCYGLLIKTSKSVCSVHQTCLLLMNPLVGRPAAMSPSCPSREQRHESWRMVSNTAEPFIICCTCNQEHTSFLFWHVLAAAHVVLWHDFLFERPCGAMIWSL